MILFVIVIPVTPKMVQVWEVKALEQEIRSLFEAYPIQYCCNLRAMCSQVRLQIPRQAEA